MPVFEKRIRVPVGADALYAWHARPGAFLRLGPPWERVRLLSHTGGLADGAVVRVRVRAGPFSMVWTMRHEGHVAGRRFVDVMERGPFPHWRHEHRFEPVPAGESELVDRLEITLPGGRLGAALGGGFLRRRLGRLFTYRHAVTRGDLEFRASLGNVAPMNVLVSGAGGLVGSALTAFLSTQGHEVRGLGRKGGEGAVRWDVGRGELDPAALDGIEGVVHLAGANVAAGRWTAARKREILESRVNGARLLVDAFARMPRRPRVLVSASAVGLYGDAGGRLLDEAAPEGSGFLAEVCRAWEAEALRARELGVRVVILRIGVVLTPAGGALARLLPIFKVGLGGPVAGGAQWMSWISLDDLLGVIGRALVDEATHGVFNAVAPEPVTNAAFTAALGRVLGRPAIAPVPAVALELAYGEMARATVLASQRAVPARLLAAGHRFRHPTVEEALRHVLGRAVADTR